MRLRVPGLLVVVLLACAPGRPAAQVTGVVLDAETNEPLPSANVYLENTTRGTATDAAGRFTLADVPEGRYTLAASMLGYAVGTAVVVVRPGSDPPAVRLRLQPQAVDLGGVTVEGDRRAWRRRLDRFTRAFLGESRNASRVEILNPEVLRFFDEGVFRAQAVAPLRLRNDALGYAIHYDLVHFELDDATLRMRGHAFFEPLEPGSRRERSRWREARAAAYRGSIRHFAHALASGDLFGSGFSLWYADTASLVDPEEGRGDQRHVRVTDLSTVFEWDGTAREARLRNPQSALLRVDFRLEPEDRAYVRWMGRRDSPGDQTSWLSFPSRSGILDLGTGQTLDPLPFHVTGYWAWHERLPNWLPVGYDPRRD